MIVSVNEEWRIGSDEHSWAVQRYRGIQKDRGDVWESVTYHAAFETALMELSHRRIRLIDQSISEEIKAILQVIRDEAIAALRVFEICPSEAGSARNSVDRFEGVGEYALAKERCPG